MGNAYENDVNDSWAGKLRMECRDEKYAFHPVMHKGIEEKAGIRKVFLIKK